MTSLDQCSRSSCPKFYTCIAMVCPLDEDWYLRVHLSGERVCIFLLEYYKEKGTADNIPDFICDALCKHAEDILKQYGIICSQVSKSACVPSRISQFKSRLASQSPD